MAILDPEMQGLSRSRCVWSSDRERLGRGPAATMPGPWRRCGGMFCAACSSPTSADWRWPPFVGPPDHLGRLNNPAQRGEPDSGTVFIFDLAMIPLFLGVFALYGLYRGSPGASRTSVFSDLRNIVHALMVSGFLYAIVAYVATRSTSSWSRCPWPRSSPCAWWPWSPCPWPGSSPSGCSVGRSVGSVPVIVVGTGKLAQTVASHLRAHSSVNFVGLRRRQPPRPQRRAR